MLKSDLAKALGAVIRRHRLAKSLTQEALSERADVGVKMLRKVEHGDSNPSINLADSIAHGLGVKLSELVAEAEQLRGKQK